jgi:hypothetical protein
MKHKIIFCALMSLAASAHAAPLTVFSTDFNDTLAAEITPGSASLTGVQGYAGLGSAGNAFGGNFLRSATGNTVTLTLNNLPTHTAISLDFLFAAIDSLDGTGIFPSGDYFNVTLDGASIFRESFANALASQIQSYVPPAGVELARHVDLGFGGPGSYYTDSAYYLGADLTFQNIAHSNSSAVFTFLIEGEGIQSLSDESWAMDNLNVRIEAVPLPASVWLFASGLFALLRRRCSQPSRCLNTTN